MLMSGNYIQEKESYGLLSTSRVTNMIQIHSQVQMYKVEIQIEIPGNRA